MGDSPGGLGGQTAVVCGDEGEGVQFLDCHRLEVLNIQATEVRPGSVGALEDGGAVLELFAHSRHFAFLVCWCV